MFRRHIPLSPSNGFGAGQTTTYLLPVGLRIHTLLLDLFIDGSRVVDNTIVNYIEEIRINVDGQMPRRFLPRDLLASNELMLDEQLTAQDPGPYPVHFREPGRLAAGDQDILMWPMGDVSNASLEVVWKSGAFTPRLDVTMVADFGKDPETGKVPNLEAIMKWFRLSYGVSFISSSDWLEINDLVRTEAYARFLIWTPTGLDPLSYEIIRDGEIVRKESFTASDKILSLGSRFSTNALGGATYDGWNAYWIILDDTQHVRDSLSMIKADGNRVSDFKLRLELDNTTASPQTVQLFVQKFGNP